MIEFSVKAQELAKEALLAESPTPKQGLLALTPMREAGDMIGATLVLCAWVRRLSLVEISRAAKDLRHDEGDIGRTLDWLKEVLLGGTAESKGMVKLTDDAQKAAKVWLALRAGRLMG